MPLSSRRNDTQSDTASIGGNSLATNSSSNSSTTTASTSTSRRSKCQPAKHGSFPSATASSLARGGPDTKKSSHVSIAKNAKKPRHGSFPSATAMKSSRVSMAKNAKKPRRETEQQKENIPPQNIMDNTNFSKKRGVKRPKKGHASSKSEENNEAPNGQIMQQRIEELVAKSAAAEREEFDAEKERMKKEHEMELHQVLAEGAYFEKLCGEMNDAVEAELESTQTKLTETIQSKEELKALTTELSSQLQTLTNHLESAQATIAALESKLRAKDEYCEQFSSIL